MDFQDLTLAEAAGRIEARELSPVELTRAYLDRIDRLDPELNTFVTLTREQALADAAQAEADVAAGRYRGALHGIPVSIKDSLATAGVRTTAGRSTCPTGSRTRTPRWWPGSSRPGP